MVPTIPYAVAYFALSAVSGVASSKFTMVISTSVLAGRVMSEGTIAGPVSSVPPSMSGVSMLRV